MSPIAHMNSVKQLLNLIECVLQHYLIYNIKQMELKRRVR